MLKPNRPSLSRNLTRRSIIAAATGLAASAAGGNYARAQMSTDDLPDAATGISEIMPSTAPVLKFTDVNGAAQSLTTYRGSGLVLNVWATWCGPCVAEIPSFNAIAPKLAASKILILPISVDDSGAKAVRPFYQTHNITNLPILLDPTGNAPAILDSDGIPITLLIDPAGRIVARLEGGANWNTPRTLSLITQLIGTKPAGNVRPV
ncbi:MAG: hypothetical protein B7Z75_01935 [Acidocella sp. 20-57-95]|nr:MAG: hypothetical protein B7Z75_01935 [Acidocella sp. 20-57-95]